MSAEIPLFVVPMHNRSVLCAVAEGRWQEITPVPMPVLADHAFSESGWIAWAEEHMGDTICRFHADASPDEPCFPPIPLPARETAQSLVFMGQDLVVATFRQLGVLDFNELMPPWLRLGDERGTEGLCPNEDDLIVVGAGVGERLLWRYKGVRARKLQPCVLVKIPAIGSFERAAVGSTWLAVLKSMSRMLEESFDLSLFDANTLEQCALLISVTTYGLLVYGQEGAPIPDAAVWRDIAWQGDVLLIAAGKRGVGVLDLRGVRPSPSEPNHGRSNSPFSRECMRRIRYWPLPHALLPGSVVRVFPVAGTSQVLAVVQTNTGHETTLFDIPGPRPGVDTPGY